MKKILAILLVLTMMIALAACGQSTATTPTAAANGESSTASTSAASDTAANGEKVIIKFATSVYVEEPHRKVIDELVQAYNAKNSNVSIEIYGAGYSDFWDSMTTEIMAGNEADILQVYPENVASYNALRAEGVFVDLNQFMNGQDYKKLLTGQDMCEFDGQSLALSNYAWGTTGLFYRKSILEKADIDPEQIKTWSDFYKASEKLKAAGIISMGVVDSSHGFVVSEWARMLARAVSGGLYFPEGEKGPYTADRIQVNNDANVWAAQEWQRFLLKDKLGKSAPDKKDSREYFWNGVAAFNYDGPWFIGMTQERDKALMDDIGLISNFSVDYQGKNYKAAPTMYPLVTCLSKNSKNPEEAWKFMDWMASEEAQKIIARCGMVPANVAYSSSSEYNNEYKLASTFVKFVNEYAPQIADPFIPQQGELNKIMIEATQEIFAAGKDAKTVLDAAAEKCKEVMNK